MLEQPGVLLTRAGTLEPGTPTGGVPRLDATGFVQVAPGAAGNVLRSDGAQWVASVDPTIDPPALSIAIFGETRRVAFSQSQIAASSDAPPAYEWTTAVQTQVYNVGPDNAMYYPSTSAGGLAREAIRTSGALSRYPLTDMGGVVANGFCGAFFAQAPVTGLDPWTYVIGRVTGPALHRWSGAAMRGSTSPGWSAPDVFTGNPVISNIVDMRFDSAGNLWCMDTAAVGIIRYPGINGAPGLLLADVQINGANWPGSRQSCAVASNGDLWVSNYVAGAGALRMLRAASIAALVGAGLSNPAPDVTITVNGFLGLEGLAFDYAGNLWVTGYDNTRLGMLAAADLATSGAKTPVIVLTGGGRLGNGGATGPLFPRLHQGFGPLK